MTKLASKVIMRILDLRARISHAQKLIFVIPKTSFPNMRVFVNWFKRDKIN